MDRPPLIVAVAPNGARRTQADHPALPIAPDELAREAAACAAAGAALFHLHVRDPQGRHSLDTAAYRAAIDAVRAAVGGELVVQVTTEAAGHYGPERQMALVRELRPEAVSLALREIVPAEADPAAAAEFFAWLAAEPIMPQFILYSAADLRCYLDLRERGVITGSGHFLLFVLGRYADAQQADPRELAGFLAVADDTPWAVCAFGAREHDCCIAAAAMGGHVRVGFENNLLLRDGALAPGNAALVGQVREAAEALGRPLADADDIRAQFGS